MSFREDDLPYVRNESVMDIVKANQIKQEVFHKVNKSLKTRNFSGLHIQEEEAKTEEDDNEERWRDIYNKSRLKMPLGFQRAINQQ